MGLNTAAVLHFGNRGLIEENVVNTQALSFLIGFGNENNLRTNGPVIAHLISWPRNAQNIQNLENIWQRNDIDLQYSHTFIISISCLHLPNFRSQAAIVSEKSTVSLFSIEKPKLPNLTLPENRSRSLEGHDLYKL